MSTVPRFDPILFDSNGKGGFHLFVFLAKPMAAKSVRAFVENAVKNGIMYKEGESIITTPIRGQFPINKMDNPAYDLVDMEMYNFRPPWVGRQTLPIITSRGCPMRCSYCYNTQFSQKNWNSLSPEKTVALINGLISKYKIKDFSLFDDNFFVNLKRVRRICELIIGNNLDIAFHNVNCRVDTVAKMDDEFLGLLVKAGFKQLLVGVESGSNTILSRIKKDITVDQILTVNTKLKNAGITSFYSFMAGFPFETVDDIHKTLILMNRLLTENPDTFVFKKVMSFTNFFFCMSIHFHLSPL